MPAIVPRWEWRSFARGFGPAEVLLQPPDAYVTESDEIYLLSTSGTGIVKVREGLMDVKRLQAVDEHGLEQWIPVLKADFPLAVADLDVVTAALGLTVVAPARSSWSLGELLAEVVEPHPELSAVGVHKRRVRSTLDGCMVELTDVTAGGWRTRSAAAEAPDPDHVVEVVGRLGLASRPNLNYGRGLVVLLGLGDPRCAVVDVGTNSVKFHVGERHGDGSWRTVVDRAEVTRLGDGSRPADGSRPKRSRERSRRSPTWPTRPGSSGRWPSSRWVRRACAWRPTGRSSSTPYAGGAASSWRRSRARRRPGWRPAPLRPAWPDPGRWSCSTPVAEASQFTFGHDDQVDEQFSVPVGAVRLTERFALAGPVTEHELSEVADEIGQGLSRVADRAVPDQLIGMGGALTDLAAVRHGLTVYDPEVVHGTVLDREEVDRQIELYRTRGAADRRHDVVGLQPSRAEVILAGACIVRAVLEMLGADSITVSDRGLARRRPGGQVRRDTGSVMASPPWQASVMTTRVDAGVLWARALVLGRWRSSWASSAT